MTLITNPLAPEPSHLVQEISQLLYQLRTQSIREAAGTDTLADDTVATHTLIMKHVLSLSRLPSESAIRAFEEFLDTVRSKNVSEAFHDIVEQFKKG